MAKVEPQIRVIRGKGGGVSEVVTWGPMSPGDEIGWHDLANSEIGHCNSVQIEGDFNGVQCHIEGSNTGIAGRLLHSAIGMEAVMDGAGGIAGIGEATRYIRPVLKGGDASSKITVTTFGRSA